MWSLGRLAARRIARIHWGQTSATLHPLSRIQGQTAAGHGVANIFDSLEIHRCASLSNGNGFRSSAAVLTAQDIVVPSMGDSITEGTIVSVTKSKGDPVKEDEVIAQIETDKVTIDVRVPNAGILIEILVSEDQNVGVGDVVARFDDAGGGKRRGEAKGTEAPCDGGKPSESEQPDPKESEVNKDTAQKSGDSSDSGSSRKAAASAEPAPKVGGRPMDSERPQPTGDTDNWAPSNGRAHLVFPPRRLEDGRRISDLPPDEAARHTQRLSGSSPAEQQQQQQQQQQAEETESLPQSETTGSESEGVMRRRWAVGAPLPKDEDWQPAPGKWALSDAEMEMIDLGGAEP